MSGSLWQIVDDEALHDWLNERPPPEQPDPNEYADDPSTRKQEAP